jgi:hypothetical protein
MTKHLILARLRSIKPYNLSGIGCGWCYSVVYCYPGSGDGKGSSISDFTHGEASKLHLHYAQQEQGDGYLEYEATRLFTTDLNMEEAFD